MFKTTFIILTIMLLGINAKAALVAHEWGTFTSLVGSNGLTQHGMYHEDEKLPDFVHPFGATQNVPIFPLPDVINNSCQNFKSCFSMDTLRQNVISQKMETPVIYFYGTPEIGNRVKVDVRFPEGVITETFPAPIASFPKNGDFVTIKDGSATFDVEILSATVGTIPYVKPTNIYGHARNTNSQLVRTNNETEKFIFYRGLGRFQPRLHIMSNNGDLRISSTKENQPQGAYLVSVSANGQKHQMLPISEKTISSFPSKLNPLGGFYIDPQTITHLSKNFEQPLTNIIQNPEVIRGYLHKGLLNAGLYDDEANAMLDTWEHGYLKVPGLRLLYILPENEVNEILPISFTPSVDRFQRAFIARIEIMTDNEEDQILQTILTQGSKFDIATLGRFAEPKLRRVDQVYSATPGFDMNTLRMIQMHIESSITATSSETTHLE